MMVAASLVTNSLSKWLMIILFMPFGPKDDLTIFAMSLHAFWEGGKGTCSLSAFAIMVRARGMYGLGVRGMQSGVCIQVGASRAF